MAHISVFASGTSAVEQPPSGALLRLPQPATPTPAGSSERVFRGPPSFFATPSPRRAQDCCAALGLLR
ncbi:uncharacterized protein SCHCODRAFT_02612465 [Schizophyllum commune H4-8]|uniref:uncharacterized protein n=1 Tax=Schizophyllum commune (strain H4-8 / FGSC 9210) TaxID=578458 RepID=UPI002160A83B|nr:uncharacterized protein SCHCODRAFT_02612465 [Schizophyllum commune H4-8]KAI5898562.1 hypothetical protein SCHCODRAFT_02612465 [Schizophyllum commune H4-8]